MNHLLFTALLIALLYYFCYYLPSQKQLSDPHPTKLTHSQFIQTEPTQIVIEKDKKELAELKLKNQALIKEIELLRKQKEDSAKQNKDYQNQISTKQSQITQLQTQIRDLVKRPLKPTNSKTTQTDSETELTNTLDNLIKEIQNLNNSL